MCTPQAEYLHFEIIHMNLIDSVERLKKWML